MPGSIVSLLVLVNIFSIAIYGIILWRHTLGQTQTMKARTYFTFLMFNGLFAWDAANGLTVLLPEPAPLLWWSDAAIIFVTLTLCIMLATNFATLPDAVDSTILTRSL